jgi:hypothetical protein
MKTRIPIGLAFLVLALVCAVSPVSTVAFAQRSTTYDYRRQQDFSSVKTFSFKSVPVPTAGTAETTTYDGPLMDERTKAAIARQLESRGLRRDDENPDVVVSSRRTFKTEYTVYGGYGWYGPGWGPYGGYRYSGYPYGWGSGWGGWGGWYDSPTYVDERIRGTLTIDLETPETGALVWRGVGSKHVHETSKPSSRDKRVNEEVADIFKHFPSVAR